MTKTSNGKVSTEYNSQEVGGLCIHDGFYIHQAILAYTAKFQTADSLGPVTNSYKYNDLKTCPLLSDLLRIAWNFFNLIVYNVNNSCANKKHTSLSHNSSENSGQKFNAYNINFFET